MGECEAMTRAYDIDDFDTLVETFGASKARRITSEARRLDEEYVESLIADRALCDAEDQRLLMREEQN